MKPAHLYVCDHLSSLRPGVDTTLAMARASREAGYESHWCLMEDLIWRHDRLFVFARKFDGNHEVLPGQWVDAAAHFQAAFVRTDPPVGREYLAGLWLLDAAEKTGLSVWNRPSTLTWANEKTLILRYPTLIPPTRVTNRIDELKAMIRAEGTIVLKPLDGNGGRGIFVAADDDRNLSALLETATEEGRRQVMAQKYLDKVREGDRRVLLVDGEPLAVLNRLPADDEHRANMHVGARASFVPLNGDDLRICSAVAESFRELGLRFVGLDIIDGFLTEINVTSPTGVEEVLAGGGPDICAHFVQRL